MHTSSRRRWRWYANSLVFLFIRAYWISCFVLQDLENGDQSKKETSGLNLPRTDTYRFSMANLEGTCRCRMYFTIIFYFDSGLASYNFLKWCKTIRKFSMFLDRHVYLIIGTVTIKLIHRRFQILKMSTWTPFSENYALLNHNTRT